MISKIKKWDVSIAYLILFVVDVAMIEAYFCFLYHTNTMPQSAPAKIFALFVFVESVAFLLFFIVKMKSQKHEKKLIYVVALLIILLGAASYFIFSTNYTTELIVAAKRMELVGYLQKDASILIAYYCNVFLHIPVEYSIGILIPLVGYCTYMVSLFAIARKLGLIFQKREDVLYLCEIILFFVIQFMGSVAGNMYLRFSKINWIIGVVAANLVFVVFLKLLEFFLDKKKSEGGNAR